MPNSGFNRLCISAPYLVSNSAESHGNIQSLLIGLFLPCVCSNSDFDRSEATIYILATQQDLKQAIVHLYDDRVNQRIRLSAVQSMGSPVCTIRSRRLKFVHSF